MFKGPLLVYFGSVFVGVLSVYFFFFRFCFKDKGRGKKKKKPVPSGGWRDGKGLGGIWGRENTIRICCIK